MHFFHLSFLNVQDISAQKIYNVHALFHQFSDVKNGEDTSSQVSSVIYFPVNLNALELAVLRKANPIFQ